MNDLELQKWLSSDSPLDDVEKFYIIHHRHSASSRILFTSSGVLSNK